MDYSGRSVLGIAVGPALNLPVRTCAPRYFFQRLRALQESKEREGRVLLGRIAHFYEIGSEGEWT